MTDTDRLHVYLIIVDPMFISEHEARQHKGRVNLAVLVNLEHLIRNRMMLLYMAPPHAPHMVLVTRCVCLEPGRAGTTQTLPGIPPSAILCAFDLQGRSWLSQPVDGMLYVLVSYGQPLSGSPR